MGIFDNFDTTTWILFGFLAAALLAYYFWPESTRAQAEVKRDDETRKQAKSLIALANDVADQQIFGLSHMPLRIQVTDRLRNRLSTADRPDAKELTEALWIQQRAMITRLESELDYAQQADISDHFAIAAPANQPEALLGKTLKELEGLYGQIRKLLNLGPSYPLWHGRALVLMLSNRKLFDHVAWLTGAGLAASAPGAFTLSDEDVVTITIYATRLGGFARPLTLQVCRAAVCATGGTRTPLWVEYGMASWLTTKTLGKLPPEKDEQPPVWTEQFNTVIGSIVWTKSSDDSAKLEQLVIASALLVEDIMNNDAGRMLKSLSELRAKPDAFSWASEAFPAIGVSPA